MGTVNPGIPQELALLLAQVAGLRVFVETGTHQGRTTLWAAEHFERVYTIERAEGLFRQHSEELRRHAGVTPMLGDSREVLPQVLAEIGAAPALHWLDGHWSGGVTAGADDECPLMGELAALAARPEDAILIDDARLFLSVPPKPHQPGHWPTIVEVVRALSTEALPRYVQVIDDVIVAVPDRAPMRPALEDYAQRRATEALDADASRSLGGRAMGRLRRAIAGS